jgi:hypothetical protein
VKSLSEIQDRHPGFEERTPDLPPFPPLEAGEDPPPPTFGWVLPTLLYLSVCLAVAGLLAFVIVNAREAALQLSR